MHHLMKNINIILVVFLHFVSPLAQGASSFPQGTTYSKDRLMKIYAQETRLFQDLINHCALSLKGDAEHQAKQIVRDYEAFINYNKDYVEGYVMLGKFLRKIGQVEEANEIFLRANKIDPNIAVVKQQIGNYLAEKEDFGLAMYYYLNAIELEPDVALYHYCLGELYYQYKENFIAEEILKEHEFDRQMLTAFKESVRLEPHDRVLKIRLAEAYYDLYRPDWKKALRLWKELERSSPDNIDRQIIFLHQARVLSNLERYDESKHLLSQVTAIGLKSSKEEIEEMLPKSEGSLEFE